jgi:predicted kinase
MDLWRRELPRHANTVLNTYVAETGDVEGLRLLPLFLACRSAVRAKTSATAAQLQQDLQRRGEQEATARTYLALAARLLAPPAPCVVAIGGFSGSGKSTIARALAPSIGAVPGAIVVRSDEVRKRLCGVDPLTRLDAEGYSADISRRVYDEIVQHAKRITVTGQSVVADAVFARKDDRDAIEHAAKSAGVPFVGLWLDAPEDVLAARLRGRQADASDADPELVHAQLATGAGKLAWPRLDASGEPDEVARDAVLAVEEGVNATRLSASDKSR